MSPVKPTEQQAGTEVSAASLRCFAFAPGQAQHLLGGGFADEIAEALIEVSDRDR